ncbi:MAG: hypothetical protein GY892_03345 [Shimia sp.]|nr:hypothetical protein [Shimia sp.]
MIEEALKDLTKAIKDLTEATNERRKETASAIEKITGNLSAAVDAEPQAETKPKPKPKPKAKPKVEPKVETDDAETTSDGGGKEISLEDLHAMVMLKSRAGHQSTIREFLDGFKVRKLSDLTYDQRCEMRGLVETLKDKK